MPKVEPSGYAEGRMGINLVPLSDLDRANAEIERLEALTKKLGRIVLTAHRREVLLFKALGIKIAADGTVTEIGHG